MKHVVVTGLGFGDEGKGTIVDYLCASGYDYVVRYNGGCQAAHNVVSPYGEHTFAQFGAGTLREKRTILSRHMLVEPFSLAIEAEHLESLGVPNPLGMVVVDFDCLVTTPYHWFVNRYRSETVGHGTCGRGIGETVRYALQNPGDELRVIDLFGRSANKKLKYLREWCHAVTGSVPQEEFPVHLLADRMRNVFDMTRTCDSANIFRRIQHSRCVFEGAQGVLLDEWKGFHPHTTWSTTTRDNADALLGTEEALHLGVIRNHHTRHGNGPLPTWDARMASTEAHNGDGGAQGQFRVGHFDQVLFRYALEASPCDALAVTHLDRTDVRVCTKYSLPDQPETVLRLHPPEGEDLVRQEALTSLLNSVIPEYSDETPMTAIESSGVPVMIESYGPMAFHKTERVMA